MIFIYVFIEKPKKLKAINIFFLFFENKSTFFVNENSAHGKKLK
jgi:hypothetical protein